MVSQTQVKLSFELQRSLCLDFIALLTKAIKRVKILFQKLSFSKYVFQEVYFF